MKNYVLILATLEKDKSIKYIWFSLGLVLSKIIFKIDEKVTLKKIQKKGNV
jgi:hypothetical protein